MTRNNNVKKRIDSSRNSTNGNQENNRQKGNPTAHNKGGKKNNEQSSVQVRKAKNSSKRENKRSNLQYSYYFDSKRDPYVVNYGFNDFPDIDQIIAYYINYDLKCLHPLYEYGWFDIKELVEIIKIVYSIKRQDDYKIVTTGGLFEYDEVYGDEKARIIKPELFFCVGNSSTLANLFECNRNFYEDGSGILLPDGNNKDLILLSPDNSIVKDTLGIRTRMSDSSDVKQRFITYHDYLSGNVEKANYLSKINIFEVVFEKIVKNYNGILSTLSVGIHPDDEFVAKILLSIVIYKKNCQKEMLSNNDYSYIFRKLFNEEVNVSVAVGKDIPKTLKYMLRKDEKNN